VLALRIVTLSFSKRTAGVVRASASLSWALEGPAGPTEINRHVIPNREERIWLRECIRFSREDRGATL
jgi:hypothetical protein